MAAEKVVISRDRWFAREQKKILYMVPGDFSQARGCLGHFFILPIALWRNRIARTRSSSPQAQPHRNQA